SLPMLRDHFPSPSARALSLARHSWVRPCRRDRIMRMQTFDMPNMDRGMLCTGSTQSRSQPPGGVLDEHQIGPIERGKGLLVGALDRSLYRGRQRLLNPIDQRQQAQALLCCLQVDGNLGLAALA